MGLTLEDIKKCNTNSTGEARDVYGLVENVRKLIEEDISGLKGQLITGDRLFDPKYYSSLEYAQKAVHHQMNGGSFEKVHYEIAQRAYFKRNAEKANWYEAIKELSSEIFSSFRNHEINSYLGVAIFAQTLL